MKRREFITLLGGAAAARPLTARAQQPEGARRIGFWVGEPESNPNAQRRVAAFKQGLQNLNWRGGHNVKIEYRWAILNLDGIRADAASLVALKPDVIVTTGAPTFGGIASSYSFDPHSIHICDRPGPGWFRRESVSPRWQHHRLHDFRAHDGGEMARNA